MTIRVAALFLLTLLAGCTVSPLRNPLLNATLWRQLSAEALASGTQTYAAAKRALDRGLDESPLRSAQISPAAGFEHLPPAVVMDLDETVLDNSVYQGDLIRRGLSVYSEALWDDWIHQAQAAAVPGAIDFIHHAQAHGVRVFFVTNRECRARKATGACPQQEDTAQNLRKLGVRSDTLTEDLMLKNEQPMWQSDKQSRWQEIAKTYRIVLFVGDDLGDFIPGVKVHGITPETRREVTRAHCSYWGDRWFIIANPMYGSWEQTLQQTAPTYLRSAVAPQETLQSESCPAS